MEPCRAIESFDKIQEELAELHEVFSHFLAKRKPIDAVGDEVSDSLAWICSAWGILYSNISLDHTIIDYNYEGCPLCHKHPCSCKPRMDRVSQLVDSSRILRIEEQIGELSSLLGARDPEMDELRNRGLRLVKHRANRLRGKQSQIRSKS